MIFENRFDLRDFQKIGTELGTTLRLSACCAWLLAAVAFAGGPDEAAKIHVPVQPPAIDLKRLEPQVARQLEPVQSLVLKVAGARNATAAERVEAYGEFGRLLHAYGYWNEAAECYGQCTWDQPKNPRWWHLLGCACESAGKLTEAEAAFRQAQQLGGSPATGIHLGNTLAQLNRPAEAKQVFAKLLAADSKLAAAHAGAGTLALEGRDFPAAIEHLSRALELVPSATRLHYSLGMAYRGAGDLDRARQHLRLRGDIGLKPVDPLVDELPQLLQGAHVHLLRGRLALVAGVIPDAIQEFRLAIKAAPDDAGAHVNLAVALVRSQANDEAVEELQTALRLEPGNAAALFNLASLRHTRGDFAAAAELLHKLTGIEPRDLAARQLLAQVQFGLKQPAEAIDTLREALALAPDDEATALQLAVLLASRNQPAEAIELLDGAAARHPDRGLTAHALARLLATCPDAKLRDGGRALRLAKSVYDANPTFEHTETLAMALAAADRFDEAVRLQKQLLSAAEQQKATTVAERIRKNLTRYERRTVAE